MLQGVLPALLTPFADGKVDLSALRGLCDFLISKRVAGLFITGTTGEFVSLDPSERRQVVEAVTEHVDGRTTVLVHTCAHNTAEAVAQTKFASASGADGIGCTTPYFYGMDDEALYAFFSSVLEAADGSPSFLYNIPQCSGPVIPLPLIVRLKEQFGHVRGTKDSSGDMGRFEELIGLGLPDFQVVCGADHETFTALTLGGKASVTSTGNAFPEAFLAVYEAFDAGDMDGAASAQDRLTALTKVLHEGGLMHAYKVALGMRGVDAGTVRPPQRQLSDTEIANVRSGLMQLGFIS